MNSESTELYKESKKYLSVVNKFLVKLQSQLEDLIILKSRIESDIISLSSHEGKLKDNNDRDFTQIAFEFEPIQEKLDSVSSKFISNVKNEKSIRKTVFFRAKHMISKLEKSRWSCYHLLHKYVLIQIRMVSNRTNSDDWIYALHSVDTFNKLLQPESSHILHYHLHEDKHSFENCRPTIIRPVTVSKILQIVASERTWKGAKEISRSITIGLDPSKVNHVSEEYDWLQVPIRVLQNETHYEPKQRIPYLDNYIATEEIFLNNLFSHLCKVPGLLNEGKLGEWPRVACFGITCLNPMTYLFAFQHPRVCLSIGHMLQEYLSSPIDDDYSPLAFPCVQILVENFNLHAISFFWDLQYMVSVSEASKPKTEIIPYAEGVCGTTITKTGRYLHDTIKILSSCNNRCNPDVLRNFVEHGTHDPEDISFLEELHVLRRLQATLFCIRNWACQKGEAALRAWQFKDFLMTTQNDILNAQAACQNLFLLDHKHLQNSKSFNITLFIHVQDILRKDIMECIQTIKNLPIHFQGEMTRVSSFWKKSISSTPKTKCDYVEEFIERVLGPVFSAVEDLNEDVQQTICRISIKTFCDSWLEHIKMSKVKFSEWGARQLKLDFIGLRTWIDDNPYIKEDTRRYLLLLDSLRQCEGVAKLLITKQGELVDVKPHKNKVIPLDGNSESRPASPVNKILEAIPAELYVQDQQQWISLKSSTSLLSIPFCCKMMFDLHSMSLSFRIINKSIDICKTE
ncbi:unnamed protein product [Lepeophtheirus salmonis]|uniref:(salmon louse) hypothetical protein n=1 Tax=Lepeophtheirus salmonis TaxID=72036 RepID=A0A7R8CEU8_LEPSM|nr:unnamed protein product [Lepeophtheirus salmonis]CAF2798815.1 unnamed protein product [Lepeophtheirus salmonis]